MPKYQRRYRDGGTYLFTVKAYNRQGFLCEEFARNALRRAIEQTRAQKPFEIVGWVLLPDHLHTVWKMPELFVCPHHWPYSTFGRWVKDGAYRMEWLCCCKTKHAVRPLFLDDVGDVGE